MSIAEELGEGVTPSRKGNRVAMPFNFTDGRCRNCEEGNIAFCTSFILGFAGGVYGMTTRVLLCNHALID